MNKVLEAGDPMRRHSSERGAILIFVALSIFVLTAMSAYVLDYGVFWKSLREAQNAADAGALSGATARAYDETANPPSAGGLAYQSALKAAQANKIFGQTPGIVVTWDCPSYVGGGTNCVRVDAYRDGTNGSNALPVFFAALFSQSSQGVKATATAWAAVAIATNCMRPFGVADKWQELALLPGQFDRWVKVGSTAQQLSLFDVYTPPSTTTTGTGYTVQNDLGTEVLLKNGNTGQGGTPSPSAGWFLPLNLPDGNGGYSTGASSFDSAIKY